MKNNIVTFLRKKDFHFIEELGQGACGKTVLLYDDVLREQFVCKKYAPIVSGHHEELFEKFVQEIKILHMLYHLNIVRVFNYYIYPSQRLGFILMEHIKGYSIDAYLDKYPQNIDEIFLQTVDAFDYLERNNILHRDIRFQNIMVREDGIVKIIDFGFGKTINYQGDFDKSITLNWWCSPPNEFKDSTYDFKTEIYFVGKLFEKLIIDLGIQEFKYQSLVDQMCQPDPNKRIPSFAQINHLIQNEQFGGIVFSEEELEIYREFSSHFPRLIPKIKKGVGYNNHDIDKLIVSLEVLYKNSMLEEFLPKPSLLCNLFINGPYYFDGNVDFPVYSLGNFVELLKTCSKSKQNIILSNIHAKLDSIPRYEPPSPFIEDDIPF